MSTPSMASVPALTPARRPLKKPLLIGLGVVLLLVLYLLWPLLWLYIRAEKVKSQEPDATELMAVAPQAMLRKVVRLSNTSEEPGGVEGRYLLFSHQKAAALLKEQVIRAGWRFKSREGLITVYERKGGLLNVECKKFSLKFEACSIYPAEE